MGCAHSVSEADAAPARTAADEVHEAELPAHGGPPVIGSESIMAKKAHGTTAEPVQSSLRWSCNRRKADHICCYNRHYAEYSGYFKSTPFVRYVRERGEHPTVFYDSVTGLPLFVAPVGRSVEAFLAESKAHGWPSFRDAEVSLLPTFEATPTASACC